MTSSQDADSGTSARNAQPPLVLFVSRVNTAASIMAEAILRHFARHRGDQETDARKALMNAANRRRCLRRGH
jgi:hypothetical protein